MGATGSRSLETAVTPIYGYSKLMRAPVRRSPVLGMVRLDNLRWELTVNPTGFNEETGVCDSLVVALILGIEHSPKSARGVNMSIEILDATGLYTVFHRESSRAGGDLRLHVRRSELEMSSCIHNDRFVVRCTVKEQRRPSLLGNRFTYDYDYEFKVLGKVVMDMSLTLPVDSYSKRFAVGGSMWYLKLYPSLAAVHLVRATKEDDDTRTRAEVSFALMGAVNLRSGIMTHTFDRDNPDCVFEYQPPEEMNTSSTGSQLDVWCFVKVIPDAVVPTAVPPHGVIIPPAVPSAAPPAESVLTPLLDRRHAWLST